MINPEDNINLKTEKKKSASRRKNRLLFDNGSHSLIGFLALGVVSAFSFFGLKEIQKNGGDTLKSKAKYALKSMVPTSEKGIVNCLCGGMSIFFLLVALSSKYNIAKNIHFSKHGRQTVAPHVWDNLVFKNAPKSARVTTLYSALERTTLEREIQRIDLSELTPQEQQALLQGLIDTCEKNPAQAKLFRSQIFNLQVKKEKQDKNVYASYANTEAFPVIAGETKNLIQAFNFIHEFAHAVQDAAGLAFDYKRGEPEVLSSLFMEANARAYEYLCESPAKDPLLRQELLKQSEIEVQEQIKKKEIKIPLNLSKREQKRFIFGLAQDRAVGKLMELHLALPCDVEARLLKNLPSLKEKPDFKLKLLEAKQYIMEFHYDYEDKNENAYNATARYPQTTQALLQAYSAILNYNMEISSPENASEEFRVIRKVLHTPSEKEKNPFKWIKDAFALDTFNRHR